MKRTVAEALALVNWKGVFYERFLLHPQVTALEGDNGAGKTTVMIAAYVVLLPDLTKLRFTNLGETAAISGDRGIYGRLGDPGRPSYAVLDLRLGSGDRLLAGVQLERRAEPTVELTPFLVDGLRPHVQLADVLVDRGEVDAIPDLGRLRELVTLAGGRLREPPSMKDYFAELFEAGVTPLRLTTDEERHKLNEMLRTSMVGGISRTLTGGMREFLLKEETGLADTIRRMRGNLETCRRTRIEVGQARTLEEEIHQVYDAGHQMFAAAVHGMRQRCAELKTRVDEATALRDQKLSRRDEVRASLDELRRREAHLAPELDLASRALEDASRARDHVRAANAILRRREGHQRALAPKMAAAEGAEALARVAGDAEAAARQERDGARRDHAAAARGLAHFREGYAEAERRAAEHHLVVEYLERARSALRDEPDLGPEVIGQVLARCAGRIADLDRELVRLDREIETAEVRRREFGAALAALVRLGGAQVEPPAAFARAQETLAALHREELLAGEVLALEASLEEARARAERQARTRRRAAPLQIASAQTARAAFEEADAALLSSRQRASAEQLGLAEALRAVEEKTARATELEALAQRVRDARAEGAALAEQWQRPAGSRRDVEGLREELAERRHRAGAEHAAAASEADRLAAEAKRLQEGAGAFDERLLRARDALEGELLAGRFEDLPVESSAEVEALLGPLHQALVVEDVRAAAEALAAAKDPPPTVWLLGGGAPLELDAAGRPPGERLAQSVVVPGEHGVRVTRLPSSPVLGRRAREQRMAELHQRARALERSAEQLRTQEQALEAGLRATASLLGRGELLDLADPSVELHRARTGAAEAASRAEAHRAALARAREDERSWADRRAALQALLPDASDLDPPDFTVEAERLTGRLEQARRAAARVREAAADRSALEGLLEVLRAVPPGPEQVAAMAEDRRRRAAERDALAQPQRWLRYVEEHRAALAWTDAEAILQQQTAMVPGLEAQLRLAEERLQRAEEASVQAEKQAEQARSASSRARSEADALEAAVRQAAAELAETGVDDASDDALEKAIRRAAERERERRALEEQKSAVVADLGRFEERHRAAEEELRGAQAQLEGEEHQWRPAQERWARLEAQAEQAGVLAAALSQRALEQLHGISGSVNLRGEAKRQAALLLERVGRSTDGAELLGEVRPRLEGETPDEAYLEVWLRARDWLRRRVPPSIAEVDEPLEALLRLRDHLRRLEERLVRQETDLRGQSEDVARNIQTQIRKARKQVSRLNRDLETVRFGSITGVEIKVTQVEKMAQVLHALQDGTAQELLFKPDVPIEDALDELFRLHGGGKTTGQKLLDFREYIHLQVQVRRQARPEWEPANPTRLSTGEAIGVGAAIMMVVLAAWERDANLLRPNRSAGTLRLLFLDEATRLSRDSLDIMFDLSRELELQLLIAAPEVARARGNTTYALVRRVGADGREEVMVSGRTAVEA